MNYENWNWYYGRDEEFMTGPVASREEAIECLDGEGGYILEARQVGLRLSRFIDVDQMLEGAIEDMDEEYGHPDGEPLKVEGDVRELIPLVEAYVDGMQDSLGIKIRPWMFTHQRNEEYINAEHG